MLAVEGPHQHREAAPDHRAGRRSIRPQYIAKCGNTYSSEWFWSKITHCLRVAPAVFTRRLLLGRAGRLDPLRARRVDDPLVSAASAAPGHKALYADDWGGLPDKEFLARLDPQLADLRDRFYRPSPRRHRIRRSALPLRVGEKARPAGRHPHRDRRDGRALRRDRLRRGRGHARQGHRHLHLRLRCRLGEKTVPDIPGICGIVKGAILPGYLRHRGRPVRRRRHLQVVGRGRVLGDAGPARQTHRRGRALKPGQSGLLALDWNNGNRTILVDQLLTGLLVGQTLYTTQAEIYRALIEGTAFGARAIIERIKEYGVPVDRIVCAGGIAEKNPLLMQIYADVTGCTMLVSGSSQACALGAAISAPCSPGPPDFPTAQRRDDLAEGRPTSPSRRGAQGLRPALRLVSQTSRRFGGVHARPTSPRDEGAARDQGSPALTARVPFPFSGPPAASPCTSSPPPKSGSSPVRQHLYGPGPLQQVAANSRVVAGLNASGPSAQGGFKPVLKTPDEIAQLCIDANSDPRARASSLWMHTFSPSKMWIGGLTALRKPFCTCTRSSTATCPGRRSTWIS
jgi:L-ribulokinase